MEEVDKGCLMTRMGVSGRVFLLVPAYPGSAGPTCLRACARVYVCVCVSVSLRSCINVLYTVH